MRSLEKNKVKVYFANQISSGFDDTGNDVITYTEPKETKLNLMPGSGYANSTVSSARVDQEGIWLNYSFVITVTVKEFEELGFEEGKSIIWYQSDEISDPNKADLVIDRIAISLNQVKIGLKKVQF